MQTFVYRCMVLSWSSGAKLTRLLASLLPFFCLLVDVCLDTGARSPSTALSRFRICWCQHILYLGERIYTTWTLQRRIQKIRNTVVRSK